MSIDVALVFFFARLGECIAAVCSRGMCEYKAHRGLAMPRAKKRPMVSHRPLRMVRPERFERPTPKFVAWCSIQLSYGRRSVIVQNQWGFRQLPWNMKLAESEGFEPSIRLLTRYSLSRGAPSATRATLRCRTAQRAVRPRRIQALPESGNAPANTSQGVSSPGLPSSFWIRW